jgi:hypothetical protein
MYDDPATLKYKPNPDYNPDLPEFSEGPDGFFPSNMREIVDKTAGLALALGKIELEYLREKTLNDREGALNDCLLLLAIHRIPPPDWLAEKLLAALPKPRSNALTIKNIISEVTEANRLKWEEGCNKFAQAEKQGLTHSNLTKRRKILKDWLDFFADKME